MHIVSFARLEESSFGREDVLTSGAHEIAMNAIFATSSDLGESGRIRREMFNTVWDTLVQAERTGYRGVMAETVAYLSLIDP